MRKGFRFFAIGLLTVVAGCQSSQREPAPVVAESAVRLGAVPDAPAARAELGTQWGEDRLSPVQSVSFERLSPRRPDDEVAVFYNEAWRVRRAVGDRPPILDEVLLADGRVSFAVLDADRDAMDLQRGRDGRLYLAGESGERYQLAFRNQGEATYEIVATVDGLDVINGRPGSIANRGYVLYPGRTLTIEGFRKSDDEVAAFRFSDPGDAYVANSPFGDVRNTGVIGAAIFALDDPYRYDVVVGPGEDAEPFPGDDAIDPRYAPPPVD